MTPNTATSPSFNPRLPGGRRPRAPRRKTGVRSFNPRLPGGRRRHRTRPGRQQPGFQSTPSGGKATILALLTVIDCIVSIHAFRGEGDTNTIRLITNHARFNPRLPGGRRPGTFSTINRRGRFQSTPSGGKATGAGGAGQDGAQVSIHAFRGEGDQRSDRRSSRRLMFQSTPSGGKATRYCRAAIVER